MDPQSLLKKLRESLAPVFGDRLRDVILFGSEARGEAEEDSDIDVMVVLAGPMDRLNDLRACVHATYPITLELGRPVHPIPVSDEAYREKDWPLYREVRKEGIVG